MKLSGGITGAGGERGPDAGARWEAGTHQEDGAAAQATGDATRVVAAGGGQAVRVTLLVYFEAGVH